MSRVDPATGTVAATIDVGTELVGVAVGEEAVWVTNRADDTASRIE